MKHIRVVELFAGVGGFRLGLEQANLHLKKLKFEVVWSNQFEPLTKTVQHASQIYSERFGTSKKTHSNEPIEDIKTSMIPDHDLLVAGFPCQDYSVATGLKNAKGLEGKKGVLWWQIYRILKEKGTKKPRFLLLENVDRLLNSPSNQRGRDFAVMLSALNKLDYCVEWRVINAADYGFPQRRRRVFLIGYHKSTRIYKDFVQLEKQVNLTALDLIPVGVINKAFQIDGNEKLTQVHSVANNSFEKISSEFNKTEKSTPFYNTGWLLKDSIYTIKAYPKYEGDKTSLANIILPLSQIDNEFFVKNEDIISWEKLRAKHRKKRTTSDGHTYFWSVGTMSFPDALDKPSRTITTAEGGKSPSRISHIIFQEGKYRRLTPIELERLNGFPDNHTKFNGITNSKRAFLMGNALVVDIVEKIALNFQNIDI